MTIKCPICGGESATPCGEPGTYKCRACDNVFSTLDKKPAPPRRKVIVLPRKSANADLPAPTPKPAPAAETSNSKNLSAKAVYARNIDSVAEIAAGFDSDSYQGTGFFVSPTYLITNAHVITKKRGGRRLLSDDVRVSRNRSDEYASAQIVYVDEDKDLALLRLNVAFPPVTLAGADCEVGDEVFAIGNSIGAGLSLLNGIVGDVDRRFKTTKAFLFNALVTHGCSGGPVFNVRGEVCGVTVGGVEVAAGMNYAIPVSSLSAFIAEAKKTGNLSF